MSELAAVDATFIAFQEAIAGRYSLERELGRGGMGVVYLAREVRLDRRVAIKLLPPDLAAQSTLRDRFMREARTAARLSHPYIVPLHQVDEIDGFVFYVMAYIDSETVAQRVATRGPLAPHEATRVLREVSWALAYAHAQGVVHRDVKPANILLERGTGRAMVTDFGIARIVQTGGETAVGEVVGTPEYMSPEQAAAEPVDGRSDLYSLGIVAHFMLTGQLPFTAPTAHAVLMQHLTKPAPPIATLVPGMPRPLAQAIDRCLEKEPARRFESGEALAEALAPELEKHTEVPVPVRVFLDRRRAAPLVAPLAIGAASLGGIVTAMTHEGMTLPLAGGMLVLLAFVVGTPIAVVLHRLRKLAKAGYGPDDLAAGLRVARQRAREEFLFDFGPKRTLREHAFRIIGYLGLAAALVGVASILLGGPKDSLAPSVFISLYVGAFTTAFGTRWHRLRAGKPSVWQRFWESRTARTLGNLATLRLPSRPVAADRPTELAIAMSAAALYDDLPRDVRASLGDVTQVVNGLEVRARGIRARMEQLESAIAEAGQSRTSNASDKQDALVADLRNAYGQAENRLAQVVTALETLRLDLLRLTAGAGTTDGVTRDIEAARALSEETSRMLTARQEAEAALANR